MLRNEGGGQQFLDVAQALGADLVKDSRGVAAADFDGDGDLDLAVNPNPGDTGERWRSRAALLRNDVGADRSWLKVDLEGTTANRDAVGAVVKVTSGGRQLLRQVTAGTGYASQSSLRLHFGLGRAVEVERLEVRWPGGETETFGPLAARQLVRLRQGEGLVSTGKPLGASAAGGR